MPVPQTRPIAVGDAAPDFTLPTQDGVPTYLKDFAGRSSVVLFFYPKDNTAKCTAEACAFRDSYSVFQDAGAVVLGISSDTGASHQGFAQRHRLPFPLLSDTGSHVRELYGVPKTLGLLPGRVTYLIDKQGIVRHIFSSQFDIDRHISETLRVLRTLP